MTREDLEDRIDELEDELADMRSEAKESSWWSDALLFLLCLVGMG